MECQTASGYACGLLSCWRSAVRRPSLWLGGPRTVAEREVSWTERCWALVEQQQFHIHAAWLPCCRRGTFSWSRNEPFVPYIGFVRTLSLQQERPRHCGVQCLYSNHPSTMAPCLPIYLLREIKESCGHLSIWICYSIGNQEGAHLPTSKWFIQENLDILQKYFRKKPSWTQKTVFVSEGFPSMSLKDNCV